MEAGRLGTAQLLFSCPQHRNRRRCARRLPHLPACLPPALCPPTHPPTALMQVGTVHLAALAALTGIGPPQHEAGGGGGAHGAGESAWGWGWRWFVWVFSASLGKALQGALLSLAVSSWGKGVPGAPRAGALLSSTARAAAGTGRARLPACGARSPPPAQALATALPPCVHAACATPIHVLPHMPAGHIPLVWQRAARQSGAQPAAAALPATVSVSHPPARPPFMCTLRLPNPCVEVLPRVGSSRPLLHVPLHPSSPDGVRLTLSSATCAPACLCSWAAEEERELAGRRLRLAVYLLRDPLFARHTQVLAFSCGVMGDGLSRVGCVVCVQVQPLVPGRVRASAWAACCAATARAGGVGLRRMRQVGGRWAGRGKAYEGSKRLGQAAAGATPRQQF